MLKKTELGLEAQVYDIITWEADTGEFPQVWGQPGPQLWVLGQPGIQCKTFYQNVKLKKKSEEKIMDNVFILWEEKQLSHDFWRRKVQMFQHIFFILLSIPKSHIISPCLVNKNILF